MAPRLLRPRQPSTGRGGRRCVVSPGGPFGAGGGAWSPLRGRARRGLLPFHPRADTLLRRLLLMGAMGPHRTEASRHLQMARSRLAPPNPRSADTFPTVLRPSQLQPSGLVELLDWTAAALERVDRAAFFDRFSEGEAVPYFYEPFLEEFDPALRKQLGVWYTPVEVVRYMVARVDRALKDDLGIPDGLASDNVYVLDPCCGTGAYLAEVLRRISSNLQGRGLGALTGARVKQAATTASSASRSCPLPSWSHTSRSGSPCRRSTRRFPRRATSAPGYS